MIFAARTTRFRLWLWLIMLIGEIVLQRLRADWRQEREAELWYREALLAEWDKLSWRNKLHLLRRSVGVFWDALLCKHSVRRYDNGGQRTESPPPLAPNARESPFQSVKISCDQKNHGAQPPCPSGSATPRRRR